MLPAASVIGDDDDTAASAVPPPSTATAATPAIASPMRLFNCPALRSKEAARRPAAPPIPARILGKPHVPRGWQQHNSLRTATLPQGGWHTPHQLLRPARAAERPVTLRAGRRLRRSSGGV